MASCPYNQINDGGACVADDRIWAFSYDIPSGICSVAVWDDSNTWTAKTASPVISASSPPSNGARVYGDWIYLMGPATSLICRYNWTTDTWDVDGGGNLTFLPAPSSDVTSYGAAIVGDNLYAFGGIVSGAYSNGVRIYDLVAGTWDFGTDASGAMSNHAHSVVVIDDKVHMLQGKTGSGVDATDEHWVYDPAADSWSDDTDWPEQAGETGWGTDGRKIWGVGGHSGISATPYFAYMTPGGSWTQKTDHPHASGTHKIWVVRLGDYIYTVGGAFTAGAGDDLHRYTPDISLAGTLEGWGMLI